ncbi:YcdB/YcdC domain-containing protein [Paenibacillus lutrae]|uniref:DUF4901 domain-containing protein n=1 Tax=Paenibacillus lutrae TaxID=2078573 RepID=A0A7X3FE94_9BACL|nr:YcdB/YcdC domain-containing protein [Paenibacillus lutrae]MVO98123.1 DUF4901 domain-containing protein [Paenibacillus lutrae]
MSLNYEELRTKALTIVAIPGHYQLVMEDSIPKDNEVERAFIWENPAADSGTIEIALDLEAGYLVRLDIEPEEKEDIEFHPSFEDAQAIADAFVRIHAPAHAVFTWTRIEVVRNHYCITYREEAGGLPLPDTGCVLTLSAGLNLIRYQLHGTRKRAAPKPQWPSRLACETAVRRRILQDIRMELTLVTLHPSLHEMKASDPVHRLVYEAVPDYRFMDAVTGSDLYEMDHYVLPPCYPLPADGPITAAQQPNHPDADSRHLIRDWEQLFGIDPALYTIHKSPEDEERLRYLYNYKEEEEEQDPDIDPLSADAYMNRKWGDSLRNFGASFMFEIEKSTGRLLNFHRMERGEEDAPPVLSREECWARAQKFLQNAFPDYASYLQLEAGPDRGLEEEAPAREFFYLPVYINGNAVKHERIMINVNASTGNIGLYMGVSYQKLRELAKFSGRKAVLTPEEALHRYAPYFNLELRWFLDRDEEHPLYKLQYMATTASKERTSLDDGYKRKLRYVDACSGELIWDKEMNMY